MSTIRIFINRIQIVEMGTGTLDMIHRCSDAGLPEPEFTDSGGFKITIWRNKPPEQIQVQPESLQSRVIILLADGPMSKSKILIKLGHKKISGQLNKVFQDLLDNQIIEYTVPEIRRSPRQQYRLTNKGRTELTNLKSKHVN